MKVGHGARVGVGGRDPSVEVGRLLLFRVECPIIPQS